MTVVSCQMVSCDVGGVEPTGSNNRLSSTEMHRTKDSDFPQSL
jgi:hypothetical protein